MKHITVFIVSLLLACNYSCIEEIEDDGTAPDNIDYVPVLMEKSELKESIAYKSARKLENPGKIYIMGNYIFLNEKYEGVHIINNENPDDFQKAGFIKIPGCIDIALKDSTLYADNSVDLVAIDISDTPDITVTKRIEGVFPEPLPPNSNSLPSAFQPENRPENTVIVKWIKNTKTN